MLKSFISIALVLSANTVFAGKPQIINSVHLGSSQKATKTMSAGKRDTYIIFSGNNSGNYLVPSAELSCDDALSRFVEVSEYKKLYQMGEQGHISGYLVHYKSHFDGWGGNFEACDLNLKGQMMVSIVGVIEGLDEIGNQFLQEYTSEIANKKFFGYPIFWQKPKQIVHEYTLELWTAMGKATTLNERMKPLLYYKTFEKQDAGPNADFEQFQKIAQGVTNKKELIAFFKSKNADPNHVEAVIDRYASNSGSVRLSLEIKPTYIVDNLNDHRALMDYKFTETEDYECPEKGKCIR